MKWRRINATRGDRIHFYCIVYRDVGEQSDVTAAGDGALKQPHWNIFSLATPAVSYRNKLSLFWLPTCSRIVKPTWRLFGNGRIFIWGKGGAYFTASARVPKTPSYATESVTTTYLLNVAAAAAATTAISACVWWNCDLWRILSWLAVSITPLIERVLVLNERMNNVKMCCGTVKQQHPLYRIITVAFSRRRTFIGINHEDIICHQRQIRLRAASHTDTG